MDSSLSSRPQTQRLPRDVQGWAALFDVATLPVLADTAADIEALRANEDAVDAHRLAEVLAADPLMTLKVMSHVGMLRRGRDNGEPETLTAALVMMGISPFFRQFGAQPTVEERLAGSAAALHGFQAVLRRSHRAAVFATGFAVQRLDHDVSVIHLATLLHDFAELLLWLHAPWAAIEILRRKRADPQLRTVEAEHDVLGIALPELQSWPISNARTHRTANRHQLRGGVGRQARTTPQRASCQPFTLSGHEPWFTLRRNLIIAL